MQTIRLTKGVGKKGESHCVMAATSIVANEKFTDHPQCVCPTITSALISLNDSYGDDDAARGEALGHLPWFIIGTRGDYNHELERAFLFADWAVRVCCGIECEPITDKETALAAADAADAADAARAVYAANAAANAAAAAVRAANAARAAAAANAAANAAAANAADAAIHANRRQDLIAYIESTIIPVHTTMPVERGFRNECLISS